MAAFGAKLPLTGMSRFDGAGSTGVRKWREISLLGLNCKVSRFLPKASSKSVAQFETFVSVTFCDVGLPQSSWRHPVEPGLPPAILANRMHHQLPGLNTQRPLGTVSCPTAQAGIYERRDLFGLSVKSAPPNGETRLACRPWAARALPPSSDRHWR
jgi:hypothetical protein